MSEQLVAAGYASFGSAPLPAAQVGGNVASWEGSANHYQGLRGDSTRALRLGGDNYGLDTDALNTRVTGDGGALALAGNLGRNSSVTAGSVLGVGRFQDWMKKLQDNLALIGGALIALGAAGGALALARRRRLLQLWRSAGRLFEEGMAKFGKMFNSIGEDIKRQLRSHSARFSNHQINSRLASAKANVEYHNGGVNIAKFKAREVNEAVKDRIRAAYLNGEISPAEYLQYLNKKEPFRALQSQYVTDEEARVLKGVHQDLQKLRDARRSDSQLDTDIREVNAYMRERTPDGSRHPDTGRLEGVNSYDKYNKDTTDELLGILHGYNPYPG